MSNFPWLPVAVSATVSAAATFLVVRSFQASPPAAASDKDKRQIETLKEQRDSLAKEKAALAQENANLQASIEAKSAKIVRLHSENEMLTLMLSQGGTVDREVRSGMEDAWLFGVPANATVEEILSGLDLGVDREEVQLKILDMASWKDFSSVREYMSQTDTFGFSCDDDQPEYWSKFAEFLSPLMTQVLLIRIKNFPTQGMGEVWGATSYALAAKFIASIEQAWEDAEKKHGAAMAGEVAVVLSSAPGSEHKSGDSPDTAPTEVRGEFSNGTVSKLDVVQLELKGESDHGQRSTLHGSMDHEWVSLSHGFSEP